MITCSSGDETFAARRACAAAGAVDQSVPPRSEAPATPARLRNVPLLIRSSSGPGFSSCVIATSHAKLRPRPGLWDTGWMRSGGDLVNRADAVRGRGAPRELLAPN